jgi:hypothetical protein
MELSAVWRNLWRITVRSRGGLLDRRGVDCRQLRSSITTMEQHAAGATRECPASPAPATNYRKSTWARINFSARADYANSLFNDQMDLAWLNRGAVAGYVMDTCNVFIM